MLLFWNITFNNPFVLNVLNVANCYFFKCERVKKLKKLGKIPDFLDELGSEKIGKFLFVTLNFSAFSGINSNEHYIFQLLEECKVTKRNIF